MRDYQRLSLEFYHLDALRFMTLPSLSLQSAIKMSGVELELISDPTLHLFWERMIRGGISFCGNRYAKANVPQSSTYDPSKAVRHILYFDANNLYGNYIIL